ncbi:MAG: UDP-glucose/GDP-mannose dehydrogenase family protein [Capsulimonas sp.]|uniref:UDP-glucose dehydrogenase family protein n=1 Tax=Capsulimonas sp. TaxID=2494211 RepID=UPI003265307D
MNICVIGTGYVGLVTGVVFSDLGNDVVCVDKLSAKIDGLNKGIMPIYEPGLEEMVARNVADGRLQFSTDLDAAVTKAEVVFIAVGTPPREDGSTDLSYVEDAAKGVARALNSYKVIVNKSTVPVGTGDFVRQTIMTNRRRAVDFDVVSNPEFLREGSAITDTLVPDRIVIGAPNRVVAMRLLELYAPLERPMIITDVASAEMIKYASNAFLATKISFANAVANICEVAGADVTQVVKGMGLDSRIGAPFLSAGLGYGGSCFPKDTRSLLHTAQEFGYDFPLLKATIETNDEQPRRFIRKIHSVLGGDDLKGLTVGVLGLAFKPNTDDMREAKSLDVITDLLACGATVKAYDPIAIENTRAIFPHITYGANAYEVAAGADALIVVTEWNEFKTLNFERLASIMNRPLILDGRNIYDPETVRRNGFEYHSIGRAPLSPIGAPTAAKPATQKEAVPSV